MQEDNEILEINVSDLTEENQDLMVERNRIRRSLDRTKAALKNAKRNYGAATKKPTRSVRACIEASLN